MLRLRGGAGGLVSAAMLCLLSSEGPRAAAQQDPDRLLRPIERILRPPRAAGEFLVRFRAEATPDQRAAVRGRIGARLERLLDIPARDPRGPLQLLKLPAGADEAAALKQLTADPAVHYAEPNYRVFKNDTLPNDPRFGSLWGLHNTGQSGGTADADIDAPAAWDLTTGSASVVVAVLDTGVDYTHPDLAANMWVNPEEIAGNGIDDDENGFVDDIHGWDFAGAGNVASDQDGDPMDEEGHGTHVAGTIGAVGNNGTGATGVAWTVKIIALRFLGTEGGFTSDAIAAYGYVLDLKSAGVNLVAVNNSWGGGGFNQSLVDALQAAGDAGILSVCAAGNSGVNVDDFPHYPSSYDLPSIISVGASDRTEQAPLFSNFGADGVDLFAPGAAIVSTVPSAVAASGYAESDGTSMAAPHVTGAAVLLASYRPLIGVAEMRARLLFSVDKRDGYAGRAVTCGRLNVRRALEDDDAAAPGSIADLAAPPAEASYAAVQLTWTAPGDDGLSGQASAYEIRFSTTALTALNFDDAERVPCPPLPLAAGSPQTHRVCGLQSSTTYYFAMRTYDNVGNASPISNIASATTQAESAAVAIFQDDFQSGAFSTSLWALVDSPWDVRNNGGSQRARDSNTNYANDADTSIVTVPFNLSNRKDATLSFVHRYAFEAGYDFGIVQVSTDGTTWRRLSHYSATKASYGSVDRLCLSAYDGFPSVQIRFRVLADNVITADGWWLDDIRVLAQSTVTNQPPVADDKNVATNEDTSVGITLTGSDPDGDPITFSIVTGPAHGALTGTGANRTYTPAANYNGPDQFTFRANDGGMNSNTATVSITVTAVNDAPSAASQNVTTAEDTPKGITLSGSDPDGNPLTYAVVDLPAHGTLSGTPPNLTYTPAADYAGADAFTFRVGDGALQSADATVSITVSGVNDPPTGSPTAVVVDQGGSLLITLVASDPDGDPLTYTVTVPPANGTLTGTGPDYVYTPSPGFTGPDSLTFTVSDGTTSGTPVVVAFDAPAPVVAGGGGGGGGSCGLLGIETLLLLLARRRVARAFRS